MFIYDEEDILRKKHFLSLEKYELGHVGPESYCEGQTEEVDQVFC